MVKVLKDDKREIFRAAADANRIADWILSHHPAHGLGHAIPTPRTMSSRHRLRMRP